MSDLTTQYQRSLEYELGRMNHALGIGKDGLLLELEAKTLYATFNDRVLKFDLFLACKSLWGRKAGSLSPRELLNALGEL